MAEGDFDGHLSLDVAGVDRGRRVQLSVNGQHTVAWEGESLSAALLRAGRAAARKNAKGQLRGYYCGMGVCYECMVDVQGIGLQRSCQTAVVDGMSVRVPEIEK